MAKSRMISHKHCKVCESGRMCEALEAELLRLNEASQSKAAVAYPAIESLPVEPTDNRQAQIAELEAKLRRYALPPIYIDVLIRITVYNWTLAETAGDLDIPSGEQVRRIYLKGIELLRERGFK